MSSLRENICYFSRQGLYLHYKTMHGNNVFSEQVLVASEETFYLNLYLTFVFLEMCPKPHKRKK